MSTADTLLRLTPHHIIGGAPGKDDDHRHLTFDSIQLRTITTPEDQEDVEVGALYMKEIDAANYGIFVKILVAGTIQEVQLAP